MLMLPVCANALVLNPSILLEVNDSSPYLQGDKFIGFGSCFSDSVHVRRSVVSVLALNKSNYLGMIGVTFLPLRFVSWRYCPARGSVPFPRPAV